MYKLSTFALCAALGLSPWAAHALDDATFLEATTLLQKAQSDGEASSIDAAAARWQALASAEPGDPLVRAYAGSATAMQAKASYLPWRKLSYAEDGLAMIDKALALLGPEHDAQRVSGTPVNLLVRFTAASTFLALPSMFNRGARGEQLLQDVLKHPHYADTPLGFKGAVWLRAGVHAAQEGNKALARQHLEQVVSARAPQAAAAQARLSAL